MDSPLVSVCIPTYNQENFIVDALEGALMQKDCDFEIILANDGSTDGTTRICRDYAAKYPGVIRLIDQPHNKGIIINTRDCLLAAKGKYIAICEGDDYWQDPFKLKKQVAILEADPEVTAVHTGWSNLYEQTGKKEDVHNPIADLCPEKYSGKISVKTIMMDKYRGIRFSSLMFRNDTFHEGLRQFPKIFSDEMTTVDISMFYLLAYFGKFAFIKDCSVVYRICNESVSISKNLRKISLFSLGCLRSKAYFARKCDFLDDVRTCIFRSNFSSVCIYTLQSKDKAIAKMVLDLSKEYNYILRIGQKLCIYGAKSSIFHPLALLIIKLYNILKK